MKLSVGPCVVCGKMMDIVDPHLVPAITVNGSIRIVYVHRGRCAQVMGVKRVFESQQALAEYVERGNMACGQLMR